MAKITGLDQVWLDWYLNKAVGLALFAAILESLIPAKQPCLLPVN